MSNKFLNTTTTTELANTDLVLASVTCNNLTASRAVKTDSRKRLVTADLNISDITGLQTSLTGLENLISQTGTETQLGDGTTTAWAPPSNNTCDVGSAAKRMKLVHCYDIETPNFASVDTTLTEIVAAGPTITNVTTVSIGGAAPDLTTNTRSVFAGYNAGGNILGGQDQVAIGYNAFYGADKISPNIAIGTEALASGDPMTLSIGHNIAVGEQSMLDAAGDSGDNVCLGRASGAYMTNSSRNVFIGRNAGNTISQYSNNTNICIGDQCVMGDVNVTGTVNIGPGLTGSAVNYEVMLGSVFCPSWVSATNGGTDLGSLDHYWKDTFIAGDASIGTISNVTSADIAVITGCTTAALTDITGCATAAITDLTCTTVNGNAPHGSLFATYAAGLNISNSLLELSMVNFTNGLGSLTIPAMSLGDRYQVKLFGDYSCNAGTTCTFRAYLNAALLCTKIHTNSLTLNGTECFELEVDLSVRAVGVATVGSVNTCFKVTVSNDTTPFYWAGSTIHSTNTTTVDTTVANVLNITAQWSNIGTANQCQSQQVLLTQVY